MGKKINVVEVGARDGLQNEAKPLSTSVRWKLIERLVDAGLETVEVGSFVSPKWVPQMKNSQKLVELAIEHNRKQAFRYPVLVPNMRGMHDAIASGAKEVAVFGACSESFSRKNINCSIEESFQRFSEVVQLAHKNKIKVRGYLSMAFGCPYEGEVKPSKVVQLARKMLHLGVYQVSIGDTIGVATPRQVRTLLKKLVQGQPAKKLAMHFHDTRGTALANVLASLDFNITTFDSSLGGLGGCPYAVGASGNLATEDLVYMLHGMGYSTGIDVEKLISAKKWIEARVGHPLPSHVGRAGLSKVMLR